MRGFSFALAFAALLDLRLFIGDVLARDGIVFLDLHLVGHRALVLGGRVEVAGSGGRLELDLFAHGLNLLAARTHFGEHDIEALLVDEAQAGAGEAHLDPAILALDPELAVLQVVQEAALRLVVGVGHVVSAAGRLPRYLANARHGTKSGLGKRLKTKALNYSAKQGERAIPGPASDQPPLRERQAGPRGHDEVVQDLHVDEGERLGERAREGLVLDAGLGHARRMVVREDHGRRVVRERVLHDLARVDAGLRERAAEHLVGGDHAVLRIEAYAVEALVGEVLHAESQVTAHGGGRREAVARSPRK